jgi:hypothetical protein
MSRSESIAKRNWRHGESCRGGQSPEHKTWSRIRSRCGRNGPYQSVAVHPRWDSFTAFLEDMGRKPTPAHTIDRVDNSKGYEPGNCRWATPTDQARNRTTNRMVDGLCLAAVAEAAGISSATIAFRIGKLGMLPRHAVSVPLHGWPSSPAPQKWPLPATPNRKPNPCHPVPPPPSSRPC